MNIVLRSGAKDQPDKGPFIYTPGKVVFGYIAGLVKDPDFGDIFDPDEGVDIVVTRVGTGMNTKYQVTPKRNSSPLSADADVAAKWIEDIKDLSVVELTDDPEEDSAIQQGHAVWISPYERIVRENNLDADVLELGGEEDEDKDEKHQHAAKPVATRTVRKEPEPEEEQKPAKAVVEQRLARRSFRR